MNDLHLIILAIIILVTLFGVITLMSHFSDGETWVNSILFSLVIYGVVGGVVFGMISLIILIKWWLQI